MRGTWRLDERKIKRKEIGAKSIAYLRQWVGATGQLLLVLRIIAGGLAWPTMGAEVRPWFLFPQRWPLTATLPYPGMPGCGPLSLQARRENISRFFSSHFIMSSDHRASLELSTDSSLPEKLIRDSQRHDETGQQYSRVPFPHELAQARVC